jgi:hypothetical protein
VERRARVEQLLPVLTVRSPPDVNQQSSSQAGDADAREKVIDRGGCQNGKSRRGMRVTFDLELPQRAIELDGLEETQAVLSQRDEPFEAICSIWCRDRGAKITRKS